MLALCVPCWFDPIHGHEGRGSNRHIVRAGLTWFRSPVRTGDAVFTLRARVGADRCARCVFVYDQCCQLTAAQPLTTRGWLLTRRAYPLSIAALGSELALEADWLEPIIADLLESRWLEWREWPDTLPKCPVLQGLGVVARAGARGVRSGCANAALNMRPRKEIKKEIEKEKEKGKRPRRGDGGGGKREGAETEISGDLALPDLPLLDRSRIVGSLLEVGYSASAANAIADTPGLTLERLRDAIARFADRKAAGRVRGDGLGYLRTMIMGADE